MGKPHLLNKFACENTEFEIQLTKQASLNLEKENLPQGKQTEIKTRITKREREREKKVCVVWVREREKGFLLQESGLCVLRNSCFNPPPFAVVSGLQCATIKGTIEPNIPIENSTNFN